MKTLGLLFLEEASSSRSIRRLGAEKDKQYGHDHHGRTKDPDARDNHALASDGFYCRGNIGDKNLS